MFLESCLAASNSTSLYAGSLELVLAGAESTAGLVFVVAELQSGVRGKLDVCFAWVSNGEGGEGEDGGRKDGCEMHCRDVAGSEEVG